MAAMKPRTGDGPLEVSAEGRGIVMRIPSEGGGRLVIELNAAGSGGTRRSSRSGHLTDRDEAAEQDLLFRRSCVNGGAQRLTATARRRRRAAAQARTHRSRADS